MKMPAYIISRDRLTCLRQLVSWLETADCVSEIVIVDSDSTYPPLLEFYERTAHRVVKLHGNGGPSAVIDLANREGAPRFIVSDCDVVPREDCPRDAILQMADILGRKVRERADPIGGTTVGAVALSLELTDLPPHYAYRWDAVWFEVRHWLHPVLDGRFFASGADSTFQVKTHDKVGDLTVRGNYPLVARHMTWYLDLNNLPPDEAWAAARSNHGGFTRGHEPMPLRLGPNMVNWTKTHYLTDAEYAWQLQAATACLHWREYPGFIVAPESGTTPWSYKKSDPTIHVVSHIVSV